MGSVDGGGGAPPLSYPFGAAEPAAEVIEMGEGGMLLPPVSSKTYDHGKVRLRACTTWTARAYISGGCCNYASRGFRKIGRIDRIDSDQPACLHVREHNAMRHCPPHTTTTQGRTASYGGGPAGLMQAYAQTVQIGPTAGGISLAGLLLCLILPSSLRCAFFVLTICALGALFAFWLSRWVGRR